MMIERPIPFEQTDPELAEHLAWFVKQPKHVQGRLNTIRAEKSVGRNDPCPCGSGKKYKKCCINSTH